MSRKGMLMVMLYCMVVIFSRHLRGLPSSIRWTGAWSGLPAQSFIHTDTHTVRGDILHGGDCCAQDENQLSDSTTKEQGKSVKC
jgi:hypothetical protein